MNDDITEPPLEHQSTEVHIHSIYISIILLQKSTIYIKWRDVVLNDEALRDALLRFGAIRDIKMRGQG